MAQQRRRPLAERQQPLPGPGEPRREPLARAPSAGASPSPAPHHRRAGRAQEPARQQAVQPDAAPGEELQLDPATIVLSLPVAISLGQLIIDQSLDALPQAALWAGAVALWRAASAPGVGRGSLDWLVDSINLDPHLRARLGVPERLARIAPPPRTRGAWAFIDGLAADVRNLQAAIRVRRGEAVEHGEEGRASAATGRTIHLSATLDSDLDIAAVDALDDSDEGDVPDIGLPVVRVEDIANLDNLWVVGPKNSGKTTLLRRLIALRRGRHWALDPHATPGKWPNCTVVGGGLEFDEIDRQLHQFLTWMRQRYKAQATGEVSEAQCKAARRTMVGDEWRAVRKALPEVRASRDTPAIPSAADRLLDILSQGRKAGICALVASHADTAESMGVSGEKDILRCFDLIIYLGALATQQIPAAARMARPAVVYDPERDAWAQLVVTLPAEPRPAEASLPAAPPEPTRALAGTSPAPTLVRQAPPVRTTTGPAAATPATVVIAVAAPDMTTSEGTSTALTTGRAARTARGSDPAARAAPAPAAAPRVSGDLLSALLAQPVSPTDVAPATSAGETGTHRPLAEGAEPAPELAAPDAAAAAGGQPDAALSPRPAVPDHPQGQRDSSRTGVVVVPGDGGELHVHVHARAEAHAPPGDRAGGPWRRKGPVVNARDRRRRAAQSPNRAEELYRAYREAGAAGQAYRAVYRELGGSKDATLVAWREGRDQRGDQQR